MEFGTCSEQCTFSIFFHVLELLPALHSIQIGLTSAPGGANVSKALRFAFNRIVTSWKPKNPFTSIRHWYSHPVFYSFAAFCPNLRALGGLVTHTLIMSRFIYSAAKPFLYVERLENVILTIGICGGATMQLFSVFSGELYLQRLF